MLKHVPVVTHDQQHHILSLVEGVEHETAY